MGAASSALLLQVLDNCNATTHACNARTHVVHVDSPTSGGRYVEEKTAKPSFSMPLAANLALSGCLLHAGITPRRDLSIVEVTPRRDLGIVGLTPRQRTAFFPGCNVQVAPDSPGMTLTTQPQRLLSHDDESYEEGLSRQREQQQQRLEELLQQLFDLHDLNRNGVLEEVELIKLNEKIAMLHYGKNVDRTAVKEKYVALFRKELDPNGDAVPYDRFRTFMLKTLHEFDKDVEAQDMIMEQFVAEAMSGLACFKCPSFASTTDAPFQASADMMIQSGRAGPFESFAWNL